jgi:hypothetical protein
LLPDLHTVCAVPLLVCRNVVRFVGACCELPAGLTDALAEAAAAAAGAGSGGTLQVTGSSSNSSSTGSTVLNNSVGDVQRNGMGDQQQQQQGSVRCVVPARLARGVKLAIVMELASLGSLFSMIAQVRAGWWY